MGKARQQREHAKKTWEREAKERRLRNHEKELELKKKGLLPPVPDWVYQSKGKFSNVVKEELIRLDSLNNGYSMFRRK